MVQRSSKMKLVSANPNCRICTDDLTGKGRWIDANGNPYCDLCFEELKRQPPYQSPLFRCSACESAWPMRSLQQESGNLLCKKCLSDPTARERLDNGAGASPATNDSPRKIPAPQTRLSKGVAPSSQVIKSPWGPLGAPPATILPRITCPHCWHVFPADEMLWVSRHAELLGDPVLGPEAALRFLPSRFTAQGEAIDARDTSCQVLACPKCHLSIPRSMTELPPLFVSLIGAPASGKSHFLASMAWELRRMMREKFSVTFNDADALFNQSINEYEETLFLHEDSDDLVAIRKTELQGGMYDQIRLGDQVILLPKPFLFTLRPSRPERLATAGWSQMRMMCLYDNAGEHFQPGMDTVSMPGTQHLAKSRVLWFLFDPTQNPKFREQCKSLSSDPQVTGRARTQRQELILSEAADRVRRYTGLSARQQHDRPLVVIVSKADIWSQLLGLQLGREPILPDPTDPSLSAVDVGRIERVSAALRELLRMLTPEFVAAAEDFCKHVVYIPVSALGRGPEVNQQTGQLGIRPRDIRPQWSTVPALYMLSKWAGGWIPGVTVNEPSESTDLVTAPLPATNGTPGVVRPDPARAVVRPMLPVSERSHLELIYTSAPRGLRPGSFGFCTVAMTGGMPVALIERLESLSSYDSAGDGKPVIFSHWKIPLGVRRRSLLSRVAPSGLDYSGRENKLAHHILLDPNEVPAGGPAWTLLQPEAMLTEWRGDTRLLPANKTLPPGDSLPRPCATWESVCGDAGWAGVLAEALLRDPTTICYLTIPPETDSLMLLDEALALLPHQLRWRVSFTTRFTSLPVDLTCAVRCVTPGSQAALEAAGNASLFIDLTRRERAPDSASADAARDGFALKLPATVGISSRSPAEVISNG